MAWRLIARTRVYRMAVLLIVVALVAAYTGGALGGTHVVLAAGVLGAIGGSLLFAPGGPVVALRGSAPRWWIAPAGRLLGAGAAALPVLGLAVAGVAVVGQRWDVAVAASIAALPFVFASAACGMVLGPTLGEGGAGAVGFIAVWIGGLPPSAIQELLAGVPYLQRPAVLLWNTLPLAWRARGVLQGDVRDLLVLLCWIGVCVVLTAWVAERVSGRAVSGWRVA